MLLKAKICNQMISLKGLTLTRVSSFSLSTQFIMILTFYFNRYAEHRFEVTFDGSDDE